MAASTGPNGSVASPSRLANNAVITRPALGITAQGPVETNYADINTQYPYVPFYNRRDSILPSDTAGTFPEFYQVDKEYPFANTAGISMGQNPVAYNPLLSRVVQTTGKPSEPLSWFTKRYPNASRRREFQSWAQRFPAGPAAPGKGQYLYTNRYYPQNLPTQITGDPITGGAVAGVRYQQGSLSPAFVEQGKRGMKSLYQYRQTRLAPAISYSSTTQTLGASIFTEGPLGQGTTGGG